MIYILLALLLYSATILLGAVASRNANTHVVTAIMNGLSAFLPIALAVPLINKKMIFDSKLGITAAVLAGITIALFTLFLNKSFTVNKVGIVTPLVFGGSIFLSTLLSFVFFKEKITFYQGIGLFLLAVGLSFIIYAKTTGR